MCTPRFHPDQLPDLTGKIAIVTGANAGIGKLTALNLLKKNAKVYLAARDLAKVTAVIAEFHTTLPGANAHALQLDLSSFASVKAAADAFLVLETGLHILINNAGAVGLPAEVTADGYDLLWTTNYMGPFLFTRLLMPLLSSTAATAADPVRIVNVSSDAHAMGPKGGIIYADLAQASESTISRYGQTKLANILHTIALAKRYGGSANNMIITTLHPGIVHTNLSGGLLDSLKVPAPVARLVSRALLKSPEEGCWTSLYAAASRDVTVEDNGAYFLPVGKRSKVAKVAGDGEAEKLWVWTEGELVRAGWVRAFRFVL